jgi:hypothetical protein
MRSEGAGRLRLHLDADASNKALAAALAARGHDVTRTPNAWMLREAGDEAQLLGATAQGRCVFTFNARDFLPLAARHPHHAGLVLAAQSSWTPRQLVAALDRLLTESPAMAGRVEWLNRWR